MATGQEIIDMAVERSSLNDADLIPTDEALRYLTVFERRAFLMAARLNPDFFGKEAETGARGDDEGTWNLSSTPGDVAAVSRLEVGAINGSVDGISVGDEVQIISVRNPDVGLSPRAYIRDKTIFPYQNELSEDASNFVSKLLVFYSELPARISATTQALTLDDEWENLVALPLAAVFAQRDQRFNDAQLLDQKYQQEVQIFRQHVSVFDEGAIRGEREIPASAFSGIAQPQADGGS